MADELRFRVTADGTDEAAKDVGKVQDAVDQLEGSTAAVDVEADDQATPTLEEVQTGTADLDGATATVDAEADDNATGTLDDVQSSTDDLDGSGATVDVEADDNATATLEDVQGAADDLDGQTATVTAEVDDQASGPLGDITGALAEMPGPLGEVSGLAGGLSGGMLGVAAGVGAAAAAAGDAVNDFISLGVTIDDFVIKTGASYDEASRFVEVADDLSISVDGMETAIGRMNLAAEKTPGKFDDIGAAIVRNNDGTLNSIETFIGLITALNGIKDAGERAKAGQEIFGRAWQSMAPLIGMSADDLRARLDSVGDAKIFTADKAGQAKDLRDSLDDVSDSVDELKLSFAQGLAPTIESLTPAISGLIGLLTDLQNVKINLPGAAGEFNPLQGAIGMLTQSWGLMIDQIGKTPDLNGQVSASLDGVTAATLEAAAAADADVAAKKVQADITAAITSVMDGYTSALKESIKALEEEAAALDKQSEAFTSAADDQLGWNKALDDFNTKAKDGKSSTDDIRDAAIKASKEFVGFSESLITASGATQTATQKVDAQNASLLQSAATARGPAKTAIEEYIGAVNGIPTDVMTEINAAIAAGDLETAQRLLDEASAPRKAAIKADADRESIRTANAALDAVADAKRTATIDVKANVSSIGAAISRAAQSAGASGNAAAPPVPVAELRGAPTTIVNVTVPRGYREQDAAVAARRFARRSGRLYARR